MITHLQPRQCVLFCGAYLKINRLFLKRFEIYRNNEQKVQSPDVSPHLNTVSGVIGILH